MDCLDCIVFKLIEVVMDQVGCIVEVVVDFVGIKVMGFDIFLISLLALY